MAKREKGGSALPQCEALAAPLAQSMELILWDTELVKEGGTLVLRYTIDREDGVDLDACEAFSRAVEQALDEADPIPGSYRLEVQSAGIDRPLKHPWHFARYEGEAVEIKLYAPLGGTLPEAKELELTLLDARQPAAVKRFEATLIGLADGTLTLADRAERRFSLPLADIAQVRLAVDWS